MSDACELLVEVTRGDLVESVHRVAACAVDVTGRLLFTAGEIDVPVYLRSAAKPFIAGAVIEAGVGRAFGLEPREIAVMAASHSGEPMHVQAVLSILRKIGMDASALQCGVHPPYDESRARRAAPRRRRAERASQQLLRKARGYSRALQSTALGPSNVLERAQSRSTPHPRLLRAPLRRRWRELAGRNRRLRDTSLCDDFAPGRALLCASRDAHRRCEARTPMHCASCATQW